MYMSPASAASPSSWLRRWTSRVVSYRTAHAAVHEYSVRRPNPYDMFRELEPETWYVVERQTDDASCPAKRSAVRATATYAYDDGGSLGLVIDGHVLFFPVSAGPVTYNGLPATQFVPDNEDHLFGALEQRVGW